MKKIKGFKAARNSLSYFPGVLLIAIGVYLLISKLHINFVTQLVRENAELEEGKHGYNMWKISNLYFNLYLFHVTNPREVMQGAAPVLEERGPYVYDLKIEKRVFDVDKEKDELAFNTVKTYRFNKEKSGTNTPNDKIVMLNSPFLGIINTLNAKAAMMVPKLGNQIQNLFPRTRDIFLRVQMKDFLFEGLPLVCDKDKFPDLGMVCSFLKMQKPPMLKNGDQDGHYTYSLFGALNGTEQGPFTVNRGVKDKSVLGNTTSHKNTRISKFWTSPECNVISGSDSVTWAPMDEKLPFVTVYEPTLCRSMTPIYKRDEIYNGLVGYRYEVDETIWSDENIKCYCPVGPKKVMKCLPTGLLDISKCQDADAIYSEPHFFHGDPDLLDYAKGLTPDPEAHMTYIVIEPLTGAPLSGSKKIQLNVRIAPNPLINLLSNVTEGVCPFLWAEETSEVTVDDLAPIIRAHRLLNFFSYVSWIPIILGIFYILGLMLNKTTAEHNKTGHVQVVQNNLSPNQQLVKQAANRRNHAFN